MNTLEERLLFNEKMKIVSELMNMCDRIVPPEYKKYVCIGGGFPTQIVNHFLLSNIPHIHDRVDIFLGNVDIDFFISDKMPKSVYNKIMTIIHSIVEVREKKLILLRNMRYDKKTKSIDKEFDYCSTLSDDELLTVKNTSSKIVDLQCATTIATGRGKNKKHIEKIFTLQLVLFKSFDSPEELVNTFDIDVAKHYIPLSFYIKFKHSINLITETDFNSVEPFSDNQVYKVSMVNSMATMIIISGIKSNSPVTDMKSYMRYKKYLRRYPITNYYKHPIDKTKILNHTNMTYTDVMEYTKLIAMTASQKVENGYGYK